MTNVLWIAFSFDLIILSFGSFMLYRHGRISFTHPATIYIAFHFSGFTYRAFVVLLGAPTLFEIFPSRFIPITHGELTRALIVSDFSFVFMLIGWLCAAKHDLKKYGKMPKLGFEAASRTFSNKNVYRIFFFAFPLGLLGFYYFIRFPGNSSDIYGIYTASSWLTLTRLWPILLLIAFVFINGFRPKYTVPLFIFLGIMFIQGYGRFSFILPVLLMAMIYLDRNHMKWPPLWMISLLLIIMLIFPSMDAIGGALLAEGYSEPLFPIIVDKMSQWIGGQAGDQSLLDSLACTLTLVDLHGEFYFGRKWWWAIFIMWIPRFIWPDKPNMGGFLHDISTAERPMGTMGMVGTFIGDAYGQFWYFGVVGVSFLLAYCMGRAYFKAYRSNYFSVARFAYLIFASVLIQVYRDGIKSFITFGVAVMMPLFLIILLHYFIRVKKTTSANSVK